MTYHILIGDDNRTNTNHYTKLCERVSSEIKVTIAFDLEEVESKLHNLYSGIFIDITFPGVSELGPDALEKFMAEKEITSKVVTMSADFTINRQREKFPGRYGALDKNDDTIEHDQQFMRTVQKMITQEEKEKELEYLEEKCDRFGCLNEVVSNTDNLTRDYNVGDGVPSKIATETATYKDCFEYLRNGEIGKPELEKDLINVLMSNVLKKKIKSMKPISQQ